jgi:hypothetical protein
MPCASTPPRACPLYLEYPLHPDQLASRWEIDEAQGVILLNGVHLLHHCLPPTRADRVKVARLATLKGEFDKLIMEDTEPLDDYAGKISGMAVRYAGLGATLDDASMVKKLLDTVPDRLYPAVAGIEQFYDVKMMLFEEALSRLKAFDERFRRRSQAGGDFSI